MKSIIIALLSLASTWSIVLHAQTLYLKDALRLSVENYDKIKSKKSTAIALTYNSTFQKQLFLPDITLAAQQSFGTINMLNGPMNAYGGLAAASTAVPLAEQNWNAAFGSLYFANVNWNVYTFGRLKNELELALTKEKTAYADIKQEIFQHQIKVSASYFNLLANQRLEYVQSKNWKRATVLFEMTNSRAQSGLIPEVDASLAKAEVSYAKSQQIKSYDRVLEYSKQLALLMGEEFQTYELDTLYSRTIPKNLLENKNLLEAHPTLRYQHYKIDESQQKEQILKAQRMPILSLFGVLQGRGSGFDASYAQNNNAYSSAYLKGVGMDRGNYLLGFTLGWNISNFYRFNSKVREQQFYTQSLQYNYDLLNKELTASTSLAYAQLSNSADNFEETKIQLAAAQLAYQQHTALYENGLTTLVDYTQALYSLTRAEIDYEIAQNNIWQALLLIASAQGDINLLIH